MLAFIAAIWAIWRYNNLVTLKNQVANAWKQIDVQLKRRHDLIPNLIASVKGEMQFEQDTLEKVIQARNSAVAAQGVADTAARENQLTQTLSRLFALTENYPNLKANENVKLADGRARRRRRTRSGSRASSTTTSRRDSTRRRRSSPTASSRRRSTSSSVELFEITAPAEREVPQVDLNIRPRA